MRGSYIDIVVSNLELHPIYGSESYARFGGLYSLNPISTFILSGSTLMTVAVIQTPAVS